MGARQVIGAAPKGAGRLQSRAASVRRSPSLLPNAYLGFNLISSSYNGGVGHLWYDTKGDVLGRPVLNYRESTVYHPISWVLD